MRLELQTLFDSKLARAGFLLLGASLGLLVARESWVYLGAAFGLWLYLLRPVQSAFGLFVLLVPFDYVLAVGSGSGAMTLTSFVGLAAMLAILVTGLIGHRLELPPRPAFYWFLFIAWACLSIFWAYDQEAAIARLPTMLALFFLYMVVICYRFSERELTVLVDLIIAGGCAAALIAIYMFEHGVYYHDLTMRGSLILGSRQTDPSIFSASLLLPLSLGVGELLGSRRSGKRVLLCAATGIIAFGILVTMSRGALVAVAVMLVVYLVKMRLNWRVLLPALLFAGTLPLVPSYYFVRLGESVETAGAGRLYIWQTGWAAFKDHLLAGAGLDNFGYIYDDYAGHAHGYAGLMRAPHNIFLQTSVDLGVVGLVLLALVLCSHLRLLKQAAAAQHGAARFRLIACHAAAWGMLAAAFFIGAMWGKAFWLIWIMLVLFSRLRRPVGRKPRAVSPSPRAGVFAYPVSSRTVTPAPSVPAS